MPAQNIYGVDLAMTPEGDLAVNAAGALATIGEVAVVAQALQMRLRTALGDLVLHPQYGTNLPIGSKMEPVALAASLNGELQRTVKDDPRIESAVVNNVEYPISGRPDAVIITISCVLAGRVSFVATGLPAEVRILDVSEEAQILPGADLSAFEEEPFFAGEEDQAEEETSAEAEVDSIVNDITGGE